MKKFFYNVLFLLGIITLFCLLGVAMLPPATAEQVYATWEYDHNGNVTYDGERTLEWNHKNQLTKVIKGNDSIEYSYWPTGELGKKSVYKIDSPEQEPAVTTYVSPDYRILPDGTIEKELMAGESRFIITKKLGEEEVIKVAHRDYLGSTVAITDSLGVVEQAKRNFPFGGQREIEIPLVPDPTPVIPEPTRQFTGQIYEADSGLYYYNARWYNPDVGRFLSRDPVAQFNPQKVMIDPQQLNEYAYARNNPVRYNDPTGGLSRDALLKNPFKALAAAAIWKLGAYASNYKNNYKVTNSLIQHSASLEPGEFVANASQNAHVTEAVKSSDAYNERINKSILTSEKKGEAFFSETFHGGESLSFGEGDLEAGIHGTYSTSVEGYKDEEGNWHIKTHIYDVYDFELDKDYDDGFLTSANNSAYASQEAGVLSNFDINIYVEDTIKSEE